MDEPRVYGFNKSFAGYLKFGTVAFGLMAVAAFVVPFIPDEEPVTGRQVTLLWIIGLALGAFAWNYFRILRALPNKTIAVDSEGLWPAHRSREEALLRWEDVQEIKPHIYLQRLDVVNRTGQVLPLEYQLAEFPQLRAVLVERTAALSTPDVYPVRFKRPPKAYAFTTVFAIPFIVLAWWVHGDSRLLGDVVLPAMALLVVLGGTIGVSTVVLTEDHITIGYLFREIRFTRAEVEAVKINDAVRDKRRGQWVAISVRGRYQPIGLSELGVDPIKLWRAISAWKGR